MLSSSLENLLFIVCPLSTGTYTADWTIQDGIIEFTVTAETQGWVSIGLSDKPSMVNADAITGYVDNDSGEVRAYFATD